MKSIIKIKIVITTLVVASLHSFNLSAQWSSGTGTVFVTNTSDKVGIGNTSPSYKLDVTGHTNISSTSAYKIGGNNLIGKSAGNLITSSQQNTYIGYQAGATHATDGSTGDHGNVAIGYQAMFTNTDLIKNTAVGYQALL